MIFLRVETRLNFLIFLIVQLYHVQRMEEVREIDSETSAQFCAAGKMRFNCLVHKTAPISLFYKRILIRSRLSLSACRNLSGNTHRLLCNGWEFVTFVWLMVGACCGKLLPRTVLGEPNLWATNCVHSFSLNVQLHERSLKTLTDNLHFSPITANNGALRSKQRKPSECRKPLIHSWIKLAVY